jgi:nitrogen-specific signal transduction histidine kinase
MFLSNLLCLYFTRRCITSHICDNYLSERINEQWKETINSISNGILIISRTEPRDILFFNAELKSLIHQRYEDIKEESEYKECLHRLVVKVVKADSNEQIVKVPLMDLNESTKNEKFYLDESNDFIEITISKILYEKEDAMLITFIDCDAIKKVRELTNKNKYKDSLVAVLCHELRNPLDAIAQSLDYISKYIPEEFVDTLEISKECYISITSQIDDLSVTSADRV